MAVELILGPSGAGKSYTIYSEIIEESIKHPQEQFIVIVPEQFTMQTQKEIVTMHPRHGTMNIDIVSFDRLAYRIFDELNYIPKSVLEDVGKSMVIRKIIHENQKKLSVFGGSMNRTGFVEKVKSILSEFYQYQVGDEEINQILGRVNPDSMLYGKLTDIQMVHQEFELFKSRDYIVAEELLSVLADKLDDSGIISQSSIVIDGFTGFTPVQYDLLEKLLKKAKKVTIAITIDSQDLSCDRIKPYELFYLSKQTIRKIREISETADVQMFPDRVLRNPVPYRFLNNPQMAALEQNFLRYPVREYREKTDRISIHITRNPREESGFIARKMYELAGKGIRYREMAVVTGDLNAYDRELIQAMEHLHIPYFVDNKKSILNNPCIESLRAVLEMLNRDFPYEQVFRYLKTGMSIFDQEEVDRLENYILASGIRGYSRWNRPFTRKLGYLTDISLAWMNDLRAAFMESLEDLHSVLKQKNITVKERLTAIFSFMQALDYQKKMEEKQAQFEEEGEYALAKTYSQIYPQVLTLFDKMASILGEEVLDTEEFIGILDAGLTDTSVGVIPPGMDQVLVGDIERTRLKDIKVLFVVGVNDGIIPKPAKDAGIITDFEREELEKAALSLAPTAKQNSFIEQFYLYWNLTKPSEQLYLSFSKVDGSGKSIRPSYLIERVMKIFPQLIVEDEEKKEGKWSRLYTKEDSVDYLIEGLHQYLQGEEKPLFRELFALYAESEQGKNLLHLLMKGAFYKNEESPLQSAVARALYGDHLSNSVTRLEKYAACAFAHFLRYGLKLTERKEYTVKPVDMGNIFHKAVELFSKELEKTPYNWSDMPEELRDHMTEQCVEAAVVEYNQDLFSSTARNQYLVTMMTRITKRTIWALQEQVRRGSFEPKEFELSFQNYKSLNSANIELDGGIMMNLGGKIDRIDTYEDEEHVYLKIIDYKSGNMAFDIVDFYYGLQIQLVVYMNAAMEIMEKKVGEKGVVPAGIFYYNIKDPLVDAAEGEAAYQEMLRKLKMDGLVNREEQILDKLEKSEDGDYMTIPVKALKKGGFSKWSKLASTENFMKAGGYVNEKIKKLGNEIMNGNIGIEPYALGDKKACDYCEYHAVCGFDPSTGRESYRRLLSLDQEEVWEKICKEVEKEDE